MTSRIPPSRRDPEFAPQRAAKVVHAQTPGAGRVAQASPVIRGEVAALIRGKASGSSGGDGTHPGTGDRSTAVGDSAVASGIDSTSLGQNAQATFGAATAVGSAASASGNSATAIGQASEAPGYFSIAVGYGAVSSGLRSIAIGVSTGSAVDDRAVIGANDLEVKRSDGLSGSTGLRLYDEDSNPYVVGLHVGTSAPTNGCVFWYDEAADVFKVWAGGTWRTVGGGSGGGAALYSDTFTRTDSTSLGAIPSGPTWQKAQPVGQDGWGIVSNKASVTISGLDYVYAYGYADVGVSDYTVRATVSPGVALLVRCASDLSSALFVGTSRLYLVSGDLQAQDYTEIGMYDTADLSGVGDVVVEVVCTGTTVAVYNATSGSPVLCGSFTVSDNVTETTVGFMNNGEPGATSTVDDFTVTT